jgi:hypothetical protein
MYYYRLTTWMEAFLVLRHLIFITFKCNSGQVFPVHQEKMQYVDNSRVTKKQNSDGN